MGKRGYSPLRSGDYIQAQGAGLRHGVPGDLMPTIPFIGTMNPRGVNVAQAIAADKDQVFENCIFEKIVNPVTNNLFIGVDKRPGIGSATTADVSSQGIATLEWVGATNADYGNIHLFRNTGGDAMLFRGYGATITLIETYTNSGDYFNRMSDCSISQVGVLLFLSNAGKGFYTTQLAMTIAVTFTADTTNGSPTLANVSSTSGLLHGQKISGTGVPASTYLSIVGSTVTLMDVNGTAVNATATNSTVTMTRSIISRIVSTNFPGNAGKTPTGNFVALDGYIFIMDTEGNVWNSDLNSVIGWTATGRINAISSSDAGVALALIGSVIAAIGTATTEFFKNAGNPTGSPLQRAADAIDIGMEAKTFTGFGSPIVSQDGVAYIIGRKRTEELAIYALSVGSAKPISAPYVNADMTQNLLQGSAWLNRFSMGGHSFLTVTYASYWTGSNKITWAYQMDVGTWTPWYNADPTKYVFNSVANINSSSTTISGIVLVGPLSIGVCTISLLSPSYQDQSSNVVRRIKTKVMDFGTGNRKFQSVLRINGAQMTSTHNIAISVSDDDSANTVSMGNIDMSSSNPEMVRLKTFRRRSYTFTDAVNANCRLESFEIPKDALRIGDL